jgi:DNA-binding response OmpR family regulator
VACIAIIEDDAALCVALQLALIEEGYDVRLIERPDDLLVQCTVAMPDLVLLDLLLGNWGDGLALAQAIRTHPLLRDTRIVVMSAAVSMLRQNKQELALLQCPVLEKPFDLEDLLALIAHQLASPVFGSVYGQLQRL